MSALRFDDLLERVPSSELKRMARLWGAASKCNKAECLEIIASGLEDPVRVRAAVRSLDSHELTALALAKQVGGEVKPAALAIALRAAGAYQPPLTRGRGLDADTEELILPLIRRGLFLSRSSYGPAHMSSYADGGVVFADERLLAPVGPPEVVPLRLRPAAAPASSLLRRPQAVSLDIIGLAQAIDVLGGLQVTRAGKVRVSDARKLARAMGWRESDLQVDGLTLPDPAGAFADALLCSGLLVQRGSVLALREPVDRLAARPYAEQIGALLRGFTLAHEWLEGESITFADGSYLAQGRWALTIALAALPLEPDAYYSIDDLDQALFERIGEHFSIFYPPQRPYYFRLTPAEIREAEDARRAKLRAQWLEREKPWIARSLSSWLYYLGIVELGLEAGAPTSVRLTEVGRALFHPGAAGGEPLPAPSPETAWFVQPNFDIVVYLERVTPPQIAFLERCAERVGAQQHTAHYRLTRESVYHGLEAGTELRELLDGLRAGASEPVPANVAAEIGDWAARREQMTLRRRASLLEYPDAPARQAALARGLAATPIGDRFALLTGEPDPGEVGRTVDYARPPERCLDVAEDGVLSRPRPPSDLLIEAQVARWAECAPDGRRRLTAASVRAAIRAGGRGDGLLNLLRRRLVHPIPPLLEVALRAWSGEALSVDLAPVTILRCGQPEVLAAIAGSPRVRPCLRGQIAPDALLVDPDRLAELADALVWLGLGISGALTVKPLPGPSGS